MWTGPVYLDIHRIRQDPVPITTPHTHRCCIGRRQVCCGRPRCAGTVTEIVGPVDDMACGSGLGGSRQTVGRRGRTRSASARTRPIDRGAAGSGARVGNSNGIRDIACAFEALSWRRTRACGVTLRRPGQYFLPSVPQVGGDRVVLAVVDSVHRAGRRRWCRVAESQGVEEALTGVARFGQGGQSLRGRGRTPSRSARCAVRSRSCTSGTPRSTCRTTNPSPGPRTRAPGDGGEDLHSGTVRVLSP